MSGHKRGGRCAPTCAAPRCVSSPERSGAWEVCLSLSRAVFYSLGAVRSLLRGEGCVLFTMGSLQQRGSAVVRSSKQWAELAARTVRRGARKSELLMVMAMGWILYGVMPVVLRPEPELCNVRSGEFLGQSSRRQGHGSRAWHDILAVRPPQPGGAAERPPLEFRRRLTWPFVLARRGRAAASNCPLGGVPRFSFGNGAVGGWLGCVEYLGGSFPVCGTIWKTRLGPMV